MIIFYRGTEEHFDLPTGQVDIINSTLGKALGGAAGGYTTGPQELVSLLRQRARPYLFSNSLPPPVVACASKVNLKCIQQRFFLQHSQMINFPTLGLWYLQIPIPTSDAHIHTSCLLVMVYSEPLLPDHGFAA